MIRRPPRSTPLPYTTLFRSHRGRVAAQVEEEDDEQGEGDRRAGREHPRIEARCPRGRCAGSGRGRHQRDPSAEAEADGTATRTATVSPRQTGTRATSPPKAITAVAIQIQATMGLTTTRRPTLREARSMFWIDT